MADTGTKAPEPTSAEIAAFYAVLAIATIGALATILFFRETFVHDINPFIYVGLGISFAGISSMTFLQMNTKDFGNFGEISGSIVGVVSAAVGLLYFGLAAFHLFLGRRLGGGRGGNAHLFARADPNVIDFRDHETGEATSVSPLPEYRRLYRRDLVRIANLHNALAFARRSPVAVEGEFDDLLAATKRVLRASERKSGFGEAFLDFNEFFATKAREGRFKNALEVFQQIPEKGTLGYLHGEGVLGRAAGHPRARYFSG